MEDDQANQANAIAQITQLLAGLTTQVTALATAVANQGQQGGGNQGGNQNQAGGGNQGGGGGAAAFALSPVHCAKEDIIDYKTREGRFLYDLGRTPLDHKFNLKATGILKFIKDVKAHCGKMAYSEGTGQITTFPNSDGKDVDLLERYGMIDLATLKSECEPFITGGENSSRRTQNNQLFSQFLMGSLDENALATVHTHRADYTIEHNRKDVIVAPLLYKVIMRAATTDSKATSSTLRLQLNKCPEVMSKLSSNIIEFHKYVDTYLQQILSRGEDKDDIVDILFDSYARCADSSFKDYFKTKKDDYNDKVGIMKGASAEFLMGLTHKQYTMHKEKELWTAPSPDEQEIIAL